MVVLEGLQGRIGWEFQLHFIQASNVMSFLMLYFQYSRGNTNF
jgi:hypothetical protein